MSRISGGSAKGSTPSGDRPPCEADAVSILAVAPQTSAAVIAATAALGGVTIGAFFTGRQARAERLAAAAAARRQRAGEILGRVNVFLTDVEPERIGANADPKVTPALMESLAIRLNALREDISIFAAADEDYRVTSAASRLEMALFATFNRVSQLALDLLEIRESSTLDTFDAAKREHLRATTLVGIILYLVRGRNVDALESKLTEIDAQAVPPSH